MIIITTVIVTTSTTAESTMIGIVPEIQEAITTATIRIRIIAITTHATII